MEEENSIRQVVGYNNRNIYKELLKKFDEALFVGLIDFIEVYKDKTIVVFKDGKQNVVS